MAGGLAVGAEVARGGHQSAPKMHLSDAIDPDSRYQRILRVAQPFRQRLSRRRFQFRRDGSQHLVPTGIDTQPRAVDVAPDQDVGLLFLQKICRERQWRPIDHGQVLDVRISRHRGGGWVFDFRSREEIAETNSGVGSVSVTSPSAEAVVEP
jgi:hypothetical protein